MEWSIKTRDVENLLQSWAQEVAMEAQVPPPSVASGVSGPLRGVPRPGGSELVADPTDGADDSQPSANQLHLDAKPHSRRARLVAADRGDAARALPSDLVRPVLYDGT